MPEQVKNMPTIRLPTPFRPYTARRSEVPVQGATVSAALADLLAQHPALRPHILNAEGRLRPHINLFLNGTNIRDLQGLDTLLVDDATLMLVPSGSSETVIMTCTASLYSTIHAVHLAVHVRR